MAAETQVRGRGHTRLSPAELSQRGRLAVAARDGRDVRGLRHRFDELQAERQLGEAAARLVAARTAQGLPPRISDTATLSKIASLLDGVGAKASASGTKKRKAANGEQSVAAKEASDAGRNPGQA